MLSSKFKLVLSVLKIMQGIMERELNLFILLNIIVYIYKFDILEVK